MPSNEWTLPEIADSHIPKKVEESDEFLSGLAQVSCFLRISISSVRRYRGRYGLPVVSISGKGKVLATKSMLTQWYNIASNSLNQLTYEE